MSSSRPRVLYVTDLTYQARGRRYSDEDIQLSARLRESFDVALCHPLDAAALMGDFDVVVVRNSGPVINYPDEYAAFRSRARQVGVKVFNELTGRADMVGKQYLPDLYRLGFPVIPTVTSLDDLHLLPAVAEYVCKPLAGADSLGLRFLSAEVVQDLDWTEDQLLQPRIHFTYEVSFYFVDHEFQYALRAPNPARRWELERYVATEADLAFAHRFIEWNDIGHGIQRVDACRTRDGDLLLMELEDLNPYLSLDRVVPEVVDSFVRAMAASIRALAES